MKYCYFIPLIFLLFRCGPDEKLPIGDNFEWAQAQYSALLQNLEDTNKHPRSLEPDRTLKLVAPSDWTSGFFPGALWYIYQWTEDDKWLQSAQRFTLHLEEEQYNAGTHDMGFKMLCSYGNGYRLTGNPSYRDILLQSAQTLSLRYNPIVGCIKSWDWSDEWQYPVIIDNMMNLELLFWAAEELDDATFRTIAVKHADRTMQQHFRKDYSTWHVLDYDTTTGKVISRETHQGYSDESTWSRGQAWALYGYTMCYRETGHERYLKQAIHIADYIMSHENMPKDGVPYWDFNAPDIPNALRDASAAAVMCSALYELYDYSRQRIHFEYADHILASLSSDTYKGVKGFILNHGVGNKPAESEVDVPLIYADYYFLEANLRRAERVKP